MPIILLIDDSPVQMSTRKAILQGAGFHVVTATTAKGALLVLSPSMPHGMVDVVITDHIMPEIDGASFVRELRGMDPDIPVLVISGLAQAEDEYQELNVTFRQKPFPPTELIELVKLMAQSRRKP